MARKPTEFTQFKLRIRESLRRKIERAADKKAISANAEAVERIERTFDEEERQEAFSREWEERREEFDEQQRQWYEEQAKIDAEHKAALRDSRLLTAMVGTQDNAELLRSLVYLINDSPDWASSNESRIALANRIQGFLVSADDIWQGDKDEGR